MRFFRKAQAKQESETQGQSEQSDSKEIEAGEKIEEEDEPKSSRKMKADELGDDSYPLW